MTTRSPDPDPPSHHLDLPFIKTGKKLTGTAREVFTKKVVDAYRNSGRRVTIREICEVTNRSYGAIHSLLSEAGATKHGRRTAGKQEQVTS
ncbi:helix-turn-helix domain-containing protein [Streptomyces sp. NPDC086182]|uniref:helix-turn-helix domain-containing protein n=1 Tax=Streptomyces sp. NPDC086182 TaxID=3155058 RepID=UPI0034432E17